MELRKNKEHLFKFRKKKRKNKTQIQFTSVEGQRTSKAAKITYCLLISALRLRGIINYSNMCILHYKSLRLAHEFYNLILTAIGVM